MRFPLLIVILLLAGVLHGQVPAPAFRTWTDLQSRRIEASLKGITGGQVTLVLRNGGQVTLPVANLSPADREWLAAQKTAAAPDEKKTPVNPAAEKDWPRTVALTATPTVQTILEDPAKKEFIYETEHYQFICDSMLGANLVRELSRVFETTWLANCELPLDLKPSPEDGRKKFQARIFTHVSDYHEVGGPDGSAGVYSSRAQALMVPLDSLGVKLVGNRVTVNYSARDYATLIHETTHQMMNHWLWRIPVWYAEGSAVYVQLATYDNGRLFFIQQDKRLRDYLSQMGDGGKFQMTPLEKLMTMSSREWLGVVAQSNEEGLRNYASAVALTYYFYHLDDDGQGTHFKAYLRAVEGLPPGEDDTAIIEANLMRGRDFEALQKDVVQRFRHIGINLEFPGS